jgi:hypothetical protein
MSDAQGASAPAEATPDSQTEQPASPVQSEKDWKVEHEKAVAASRKWEERAKANNDARKELDELKKKGMTDIERATAEAHAAGVAEAMKTVGARLVDAEVRAAAAGRQVDLDALLEGLDRSKFITDDGEVDSKAIAKWVERVAPLQAGAAPLDLGQGARPGTDTAPDMNDRLRNDLFGRSRR